MRRDIVINLRIAASVVIVFASVWAARYVASFPTTVALAVGGLVGYILSVMTARYVLPRVEIMGDRGPGGENVTWYWLIWIVPSAVVLHFGAHLQWGWSCGVTAAIVGFALVLSWRTRSRYQARATRRQ